MATPKEQKDLIGGIAQDQVDRWKKQYGSLHMVECADANGDPLYFFLRKPDMVIMSVFTKHIEKDTVKANVLLFQNCLLNKDMEHWKEDVDVMSNVFPHLNALVEKRKNSIKKL
jgi:hypothetical protein